MPERTIRWISYTMQNIPGNISFDVDYHASVNEAREAFVQYYRATGYADCSMNLYQVTQWSMLDEAHEFEGVGCPFNYPDKSFEIGPRGGIVKVSV